MDKYQFHTDYTTLNLREAHIKIPKGAYAFVHKNDPNSPFYTLTSDQLFHGEGHQSISITQSSLEHYANNLTKNNWEYYRAHADIRVIGTKGEHWLIPRGTIIRAYQRTDKSYDYKTYKLIGENADPNLELNMDAEDFEFKTISFKNMANGHGLDLFDGLEPSQTAQEILASLTELDAQSGALADDELTELGFDSGSGGVKASKILHQDSLYSPFDDESNDYDFFGDSQDEIPAF